MSHVKHTIPVQKMICTSCEKVIAKEISALPGVKTVNVSFKHGKAEVEFDDHKVSLTKIKKAIEEKGYCCEDDCSTSCSDSAGSSSTNSSKIVNKTSGIPWYSWIAIALGIILVGYFSLMIYNGFSLPPISKGMSYGLIFVVGLLTGFHCIAMCGGFVVSYTTKGAKEGKKPATLHFSYAVGKTLSYTILGALFGWLGSIVAFTPTLRGIAGLVAGLFLVLFGLRMLGVLSLQKFYLHLPSTISKWANSESRVHRQHPFVIGLLNGLMIACGPLQAMYILAAGTGSIFQGALMLFVFGLGTLPMMLGFGYVTSFLSSKATMKILRISGIVIVILGLIMLNRGMSLLGTGYDYNSLVASTGLFVNGAGIGPSGQNENIAGTGGTIITKDYQEIHMTVDASGYTPNKFVLKKGLPVKWIIDGKQLNGCNSNIQVPKYNLQFEVKPGLQTIEFTPTEEGTVSWSCWMGMIQGAFIVQDNVDQNTINNALNQVKVPQGASCGLGGGGCGCGTR
ncbi:sulfite exporter TauE/SafE family protein [Candidatus Woesearchaeota archaeon]|nr:sulfite exporter TauE/SafE family protein [Candidatus Woesearchaeota archaeon]